MHLREFIGVINSVWVIIPKGQVHVSDGDRQGKVSRRWWNVLMGLEGRIGMTVVTRSELGVVPWNMTTTGSATLMGVRAVVCKMPYHITVSATICTAAGVPGSYHS